MDRVAHEKFTFTTGPEHTCSGPLAALASATRGARPSTGRCNCKLMFAQSAAVDASKKALEVPSIDITITGISGTPIDNVA